jgi:putative redox protein
MRVVARRRESEANQAAGYAHEVEIEGGHSLVVDEPVDVGGADSGPSPTRLVASALASCIAITMEMYAERKGWKLGAVEVQVDVEYEGQIPRSFTASIRLPEGLDDEQRERLLVVARKCPVHKALKGEADVSVRDRIESL